MPQNVCTECFQKIKEAEKIQILAQNSDAYLKSLQFEIKYATVKSETTMNLVKIEDGVYELTRAELVPFFDVEANKNEILEEISEILVK